MRHIVEEALKLMHDYREYAASIGCEIGDGALYDCITCSESQMSQLNAWWAKRTGDAYVS